VISWSRSKSIFLALRHWALYYRSASGNTGNLVSKNSYFDIMLRLPNPVTIDGRANITQPQAPVYSFNVISAAVRPFCPHSKMRLRADRTISIVVSFCEGRRNQERHQFSAAATRRRPPCSRLEQGPKLDCQFFRELLFTSVEAALPDRGWQVRGDFAYAPTTRFGMDRCSRARGLGEPAADQVGPAQSVPHRILCDRATADQPGPSIPR